MCTEHKTDCCLDVKGEEEEGIQGLVAFSEMEMHVRHLMEKTAMRNALFSSRNPRYWYLELQRQLLAMLSPSSKVCRLGISVYNPLTFHPVRFKTQLEPSEVYSGSSVGLQEWPSPLAGHGVT